MNTIRYLAVATAVALLAGCTSTVAAKHATTSSTVEKAAATSHAAPTETPTPEPTENPDGTYEGSCDYELVFDTFNGHDHMGDLNGDVDVTNTGNVGIVLKVTISWPQLGHPPIAMHKTVKVAYGASKTVPFTRAATSSIIDRLQSYQSSHDDTGCKYNGTITDTFGEVH